MVCKSGNVLFLGLQNCVEDLFDEVGDCVDVICKDVCQVLMSVQKMVVKKGNVFFFDVQDCVGEWIFYVEDVFEEGCCDVDCCLICVCCQVQKDLCCVYCDWDVVKFECVVNKKFVLL